MRLMKDAQATRACEPVDSLNFQQQLSPNSARLHSAMRICCFRASVYLISAIRMMMGIGTPSSHNKAERMIAS